MEKEMLKLDLQLFADQEEPAGDDQQEESKVSVSEMLRRLSKAEEDWKERYSQLEQSVEERVKTAKAEAKMSGQELQEHREQQLEQEKQALQDQIDALKQQEKVRELRDEARKTLESYKIASNDDVVDLVLRQDQETTLEAIKALDSLLSDQREQLASYEKPITSGGMGSNADKGSMYDILDQSKKTGF